MLLQSEQHVKLFESQYQHYGATALRMQVFEFLLQMLNSSVFSVSKCFIQVVLKTRVQLSKLKKLISLTQRK